MALLRFKRSAVPAKVPSLADLSLGELAINTFDGKVYMRRDNGTASIVEVGGGAGVLSFNSRTGAVTLTSGDVTTALGYAPASRAGDTFTGNIGITSGSPSITLTSTTSGRTATFGMTDAFNFNLSAPNNGVLQLGEFRAPIFYDSNNTAFFVDPANDTRLSAVYSRGQVRATGWWGSFSASPTALGVEIGQSGGRSYILSYDRDIANYGPVSFEATDFNFTAVSGGFAHINTSFRAPIFYDSNNTGFYVDPASTSYLNTLSARETVGSGSATAFVYIAPDLFYYWTRVANLTGGDASATLLVTSKGDANYVNSVSALLTISCWNGSTASAKLETIGCCDTTMNVRIDNNNDVWMQVHSPWSSNLSWRLINKVGSPTVYYASPTQQTTTPANSTQISYGQTVRGTQGAMSSAAVSNVPSTIVGGLNALTEVRSLIFYDSQNTAYFADPAGTSEFATIQTRGGTGFRSFATPSASINSQLYFANAGNTQAWNWQLDEGNNGALWNYNGSNWIKRAAFRADGLVIGPNGSGEFTRLGGGAGDTSIATLAASNGNLHIDSKAGFDLYLNWYTARPVWSEGGAYFPIYYDRNDTGFFINPNGGSRFVVQGDIDGGPSRGIYMWNSGDTNWGIYMGQSGAGRSLSGGTATASILGQGAHHIRFRVVAWDGSGFIWENHGETALMSLNGGSGDLSVRNSVRAPVFFDSNDTAFYLNPASDIRVRALKVTGEVEYPGSMNGDWEGGYYHFSPDHNTPSGTWGHAHIIRLDGSWNVQTFWPTANSNEIWNRRRNNGTYSAWRRSLLEDEWIGNKYFGSNGDIYGTIFYDANNSGFYVDPTGTSVIVGLTVGSGQTASTITMADADEGGRLIHCNSNRIGFLTQGGGWGAWCDDSGWWGTDVDMRAPIYYDINNTARYIDPNGSSFVQGNFYVVRDGNSNDAFGGLEIRENSFQGAGTGAATEAPGINFHWSARAAARIYMDAGGSFVFGGQGDITSNRRTIFCNELFATGNVTAYFSDERLKTRQGNIQNALQIVSKLNGFRYTNNDLAKSFGYEGDQVQLGVSAQEVEAVLPEIVRQAAFDINNDDPNYGSKSGENYKTVQYDRLVPLLIEAIKELTNEIETLKADIRSK
jgi:hypothetical protein